jgi:hypothetical protein
MLTEIKTKDLLNLINPFTSGINYNGSDFILNEEILSQYVEHPKQYNVFEKTNNELVNLYKNLALYIINAPQNPTKIDIDLDTSTLITNGLFEYVKSIHLNQEKLFISLPESGDNLLLIQSKKLKPLNLEKDITLKNLKAAEDFHLSNLSTIFIPNMVSTKNIDEDISSDNSTIINKEIPIVEDSRFFWKEAEVDIYSNSMYLMESIAEILKGKKHSKDSTVEPQLASLFKKINPEISNSTDFKLALLNLNDSFLTKLIFNPRNQSLINIDLSQDVFQDKIFQDIKTKDFTLLDIVFSQHQHLAKNKNYISPFDFKLLLNQPESIQHLIDKYSSSSSFADYGDNGLTIVSAYSYLTPENQLNPEVVKKYLSNISSKTMNGHTYISQAPLFKLPVSLFNTPEFLKQVLPHTNISDFYNHLKKNDLTCELLSDKNFLLEVSSLIQAYTVQECLNYFQPQSLNDKELIIKLISKKPDLYTQLYSSEKIRKADDDCLGKDLDVIFKAYQGQVKLRNIPFEAMHQHLLTTDSESYKENFKFQYVIENGLTDKYSKKLFTDENEYNLFKEKYNKLEYQFLSTNDYHHTNKTRDNALNKIKKIDTIYALLEKIEDANNGYNFDARGFYTALHEPFKKNVDLIEKISSYGTLPYSSLVESLQYNKDITLKFISKNPKIINNIPKEFFNDIDFSLGFAKLMDYRIVDETTTPLFINKFFENQGVTENYHSYLKSYIFMNTVANKTPPKNEAPIGKKNKI